MKYLLDSNIIIALVLDTSEQLTRRLGQCEEGEVAMSAIAYAEVAWGSCNERPPVLDVLDRFARSVPVMAFDRAAALAYAGLAFERARFDHLIAAHAMSLGLTLVTHNLKHFKGIAGLRVDNWMA